MEETTKIDRMMSVPELSNLIEPTLLLDQEKALLNIERMVQKARLNKLIFRPHFKTHQSIEIGRWYRRFGVDRIAVSSIRMAQYFASDGWGDITVAIPVNVLEHQRINTLARSIQLNLVVDSVATVENLGKCLREKVGIFIEIDVGYPRTGIPATNLEQIAVLIDQVEREPYLQLKGLLGHAGHSYKARGQAAIAAVHERSKFLVQQIKNNFPDIFVSVGDTPTCSVMEDFSWANELRPGNFVFYDVKQSQIGSCSPDQIAVAMACPVISKQADRSELVIYGGGVHFSKDYALLPETNQVFYGYVVRMGVDRWELPTATNYVKSLSQEHGLIHADEQLLAQTKVGDILFVLPIHSCMCCDLMKGYRLLTGHTIKEVLSLSRFSK